MKTSLQYTETQQDIKGENYNMTLTSIKTSFYKCSNTTNTVLKVVRRDVSNIPDEKCQTLTTFHQTKWIMG